MDKKDKRKKILKVSGLIGLFLIVFGLSYALFTITLNGTKKVKIKTGKLELQLLDKNNNPIYSTSNNSESSYEINLDNQVPVSDETGLSTQAFEFKLKNTGNLKANYTIYLDDVALEEGEERIDDEYIRYSLTKNGSEENPQGLTSRQLDKGIIDTDNTTYTYTLKIWIAEDATNEAMNKVFNATLRVEGTQYVAPANPYGTKIVETQLSETITATYYQPEDMGYNTNKVKRMSNVKKLDNEETYSGGTLVISGTGAMPRDYSIQFFLADVTTVEELYALYDSDLYDGWGAFKLKYVPTNLVIEEGITTVFNDFMSGVPIINIILSSTVELENGTFSNRGTEIIESIRFASGSSTYDTNGMGDVTINNLYLPSSIDNVDHHQFYAQANIVYCETQEVADLISDYPTSPQQFKQIIVDPTKFN